MWKTILKNILLSLLQWSTKRLFDLVDKDKNGELSEEEIKSGVNSARIWLTKIMRKTK